jgi:hypothetical protein
MARLPAYTVSSRGSLVAIDGEWWLTAGDGRSAVGIAVDDLLDLLAVPLAAGPDGGSKRELADHLEARGMSRGDAEAALDALIEAGILVPVPRDRLRRSFVSRAETGPGREWARYWLTGRHVPRADYADPGTLAYDEELMRAYARETPPPHPCKSAPASLDRVALAHPADGGGSGRAGDALGRLGHLLFWCFGRLHSASLFGLAPVHLKAVPSKGARHPFEAYIRSGGGGSARLRPGLYHYQAEEHALALVEPDDGRPAAAADDQGPTLCVTAVFERFQWRYRHAWAYKDLFLDLGHVVGMLRVAAADLGVRVADIDYGPGLAPDLPLLIEEPVAAFALEFD